MLLVKTSMIKRQVDWKSIDRFLYDASFNWKKVKQTTGIILKFVFAKFSQKTSTRLGPFQVNQVKASLDYVKQNLKQNLIVYILLIVQWGKELRLSTGTWYDTRNVKWHCDYLTFRELMNGHLITVSQCQTRLFSTSICLKYSVILHLRLVGLVWC